MSRGGSYRDHLSAWQPLERAKGWPEGVAFVYAYGTSEYLLRRVVTQLKAKAEASRGAPTTSLEATTLNEAMIESMSQQGSLFEPSTLFVLQRCEQAKSLARLLKLVPPSDGSGNLVCFVHKGETPLAPVRPELTRIGAKLVPCFDPWASDVPPLIPAMAKEHGLTLKPDAVHAMMEAIGGDLVKLDHELVKLALVHAGRTEPLGAAEVAPLLGLLREDDAFHLDRLLLSRQGAKAQALAMDLIERGEKGLALLGIIAHHCRNAAKVCEGKPGEARMPQFLLKNYQSALRGVDPRRYHAALAKCHDVDATLKSRPYDESLVIAGLIDALM